MTRQTSKISSLSCELDAQISAFNCENAVSIHDRKIDYPLSKGNDIMLVRRPNTGLIQE